MDHCYICDGRTLDHWCYKCRKKVNRLMKKHNWNSLGTRKRYCSKCGTTVKAYGWYCQEFLYRDGKWRYLPPSCKPEKILEEDNNGR